MWKSRASPTGYNPPQPPLTWRQHEGSLLVVALVTIETRGTIWAPRVLSAVAVITARCRRWLLE